VREPDVGVTKSGLLDARSLEENRLSMIEVLVQCPGGTRENSPPIYRWEESEQPPKSRKGRLKEKSASSVPAGSSIERTSSGSPFPYFLPFCALRGFFDPSSQMI